MCIACSITNCYRCKKTVSPCQLCINGWGVSVSGGVYSCKECKIEADPECIMCPSNAAKCTRCSVGFGVNNASKCQECTQPSCLQCPQSIKNCTVCDSQTGIQRQSVYPYLGKCVNCADGNCNDCSIDYRVCVECKTGYGLDDSTNNNVTDPAACVLCDTNCTECSGAYYKECTKCIDQYYPDTSTGLCLPCIGNCSLCTDGLTCDKCYDGFYLDSVDRQCYPCPQYCTLCTFNSFIHQPQCTFCVPGFQLSTPTKHPIYCQEICGDTVAYILPCDSIKGIVYDGCTDQCTVQDGFVCRVDNTTDKSTCSYDRQLEMQILIFNKNRFANEITIKIKIYPPLYVLTKTDPLQVFKVQNKAFKVQNMTYNPSTQQLDFVLNFTQNLIGQPLIIQFIPSQSISSQYYSTPTSVVFLSQQFIYYQPFSLQSARFISVICYVILSLGWLSLVLGLFTKRLAGLQAMFAIQIYYVCMVYMNTFLYSPFKEAVLLKMSTGYGLKLFDQLPPKNGVSRLLTASNKDKQYSLKYPFTKQFSLDEQLINNVNIFFFLQLTPILFYLISIITTKILQYKLKNKLKQQNYTEDHQIQIARVRSRISNTNTVKQLSLQILMYFSLFNLINYTQCSILYFTSNASKLQIRDCVLFGLGLGVYVFTVILFRCDPDPFDYFRYAFKRERKSMAYFYVYSLVIVSGVVLLCLLPEMTYLPMIPFGVMLLYAIIVRPYKQITENLRSIFYLLVILSCLSLRVYIQYVPSQNKNIVSTYFIHLINIVLLLTVTLIAIVSIIYHIIYKCYILPTQHGKKRQRNCYA